MTLDTYTTQALIMQHLATESGLVVYDTEFPAVKDEPMINGVPTAYCVVRSNDTIAPARGGSFGGARFGEYYTLVDILVVAPTPDEAREEAFGPDGVNDILIGWVPDSNSGEMTKRGGGQVFLGGDGTAARPSRYIARCSFRFSVNQTITETT